MIYRDGENVIGMDGGGEIDGDDSIDWDLGFSGEVTGKSRRSPRKVSSSGSRLILG